MNNISWRGIRAFLYVAEHGGFTAAAEVSGFSKANLSQLVTELEAALSVQLLYRTTRQLRLTEIGQGYYERCKIAMQQLDSAAEWASQSTDELKGEIRMNAVGGPVGEEVLAPLIIEFQRQHPGIRVDLDFSSIHVDLIASHYDLVMRMGELPDSTLIARRLHSVTTRYVASPEFIAANHDIAEPDDLKSLPLIRGSVDTWTLSKGKTRKTVHVAEGIKVTSGRVMRQAALAGLGVTRLADVYVQADLRQGRLTEVLPDWSEETQLTLVCPPLRHQLHRVRVLMEWLKAHFAERYQQALAEGPG
ncbi:LysR family transcriptional regulator [Aliamphritea spongicola]|uniref:LysR family transcriptional regulator n=1 Tax=Aliamphritea spongicola TaxID=707589 RepID=UPI00196B744A|nr:LysR family transcriptional regulator [Aliamphritea spongicola]MBN3562932.1 LysR family transcriptional regulator [Aliamphritea spongicola]